MISQHKAANETSKEESLKSFKELINDKAKTVNSNNCTPDANSSPIASSTSASNDNYDQQLINLCQEYIELD